MNIMTTNNDFETEASEGDLHFLPKGRIMGSLTYGHIVLRFNLQNVTRRINRTCSHLEELAKIHPKWRNEIFDDRVKHRNSAKKNVEEAKRRYSMAKDEYDRAEAMDYLQNYILTELNEKSMGWNHFYKHTLNETTILFNLLYSCAKIQDDFDETLRIWFLNEHIEKLKEGKEITEKELPKTIEELGPKFKGAKGTTNFDYQLVNGELLHKDRDKDKDHEREKRQLCAGLCILLGAVLVAAATYIMTKSGLLDLNIHRGPTKHVMEVVQDHESGLDMDHRSIKVLHSALNVTNENVKRVSDTLDYVETVVQANSAFMMFQSDIYRLIDGFNLATDYKLSPHLVRVDVMKEKLINLSSRMKNKGYEMGIETVQQLFELSASHLVWANGTIDIIVHVPCYKKASIMNMYEFLPMPFYVNLKAEGREIDRPTLHIPEARNVTFMPQLKRSYLALSGNMEKYRVLEREELDRCKVIRGTYYCDNQNFYRRKAKDSCLVNLFKGEATEIKRTCDFSVIPTDDYLIQINPSHFVLYQDSEKKVTRSCNGEEHSKMVQIMFKGVRVLYVPPECEVQTESFLFEGDFTLTMEPLELVTRKFNLDEVYSVKERHTILKKVNMDLVNNPKGLSVKQIFLAEELMDPVWHFSLGLASTVIIIILIIICLCYCRCQKWLPQHTRKVKVFNTLWRSDKEEERETENLRQEIMELKSMISSRYRTSRLSLPIETEEDNSLLESTQEDPDKISVVSKKSKRPKQRHDSEA